ncbi:MAG TPA: DUF5615 family PIN-like protein [Pyrinomonadaceae bacterium]|nr:DUF5615 family PIN-like protein [Pyrinomonadaceae bacterium]
MSRLFIELYLDEDVSVLIADLLQARGFVALTARDAGHLGKTDEEQLAYAVAEQKTFLTHNRIDLSLRSSYTSSQQSAFSGQRGCNHS